MTVMTDNETVGISGQPAWVIGELPPRYGELASQIAALQDEARRYEEIAAVLWRSGAALTLAVLRTLQDEAGEHDRVVVASNAYCETPLAQRREEPVTPDALKLIRGLGANVVATSTLFGIWRYSIKDLAAAKKSVINLYTQEGGIFR
jgi:predicted flap endonuclease-1-like 5' DNA nuclease